MDIHYKSLIGRYLLYITFIILLPSTLQHGSHSQQEKTQGQPKEQTQQGQQNQAQHKNMMHDSKHIQDKE